MKRFMRKTIVWVIGFLLISTSLFSGCGTKANSSQGAGETTKKVIKISIGGEHSLAGATWVKQLHDFFIPEVQKRASAIGYDIQFTEAWAGSVAKSGEVLGAIQNKLLDMGYVTLPSYAAKLPLHSFPYWLPFGPADPVLESKAVRKVFDEVPALKDAFKDYNQKYLGITTVQSYGIVSKKVVDNVAGFKGTKIGGVPSMFYYLEAVGSVPVQSDMTVMFTNMQTGVQDGHFIIPEAIVQAKLWEVAPNWIDVNAGAISPHAITINLDTFNSMSKEVQDIFVKVGSEFSDLSAQNAKDSMAKDLKTWEENKGKIIKFSVAERTKWADALPPDIVSKKVKEVDAKKLPGSQVIKAYFKALSDMGYTPPRTWPIE